MLTKCSQLNVNAAAASSSSSYFSASTALHRYYLVPPTLSASIEKKKGKLIQKPKTKLKLKHFGFSAVCIWQKCNIWLAFNVYLTRIAITITLYCCCYCIAVSAINVIVGIVFIVFIVPPTRMRNPLKAQKDSGTFCNIFNGMSI